eukprot:COSAG06_NODE_23184_length_700_cov_1.089850_1_plen_145_part_01
MAAVGAGYTGLDGVPCGEWKCTCTTRRGKPQNYFCLFAWQDNTRLIGPWTPTLANAAAYAELRPQLLPPPPVKKHNKKKAGKDSAPAICACAVKDIWERLEGPVALHARGALPTVALPDQRVCAPWNQDLCPRHVLLHDLIATPR